MRLDDAAALVNSMLCSKEIGSSTFFWAIGIDQESSRIHFFPEPSQHRGQLVKRAFLSGVRSLPVKYFFSSVPHGCPW